MNYPTIRQLRYFVALAETGHFGKAAEAMKTGRKCVEKVLPDIKRLVESLQD